MRVDGGTFLQKCLHVLASIVEALPAHIVALRSSRAINGAAVTVRLWHFSSGTTKLCEVVVGANEPGEAALISLRNALATLSPCGCTNFDSWASELRATIAAAPALLHSVLLITDGGATSRETFFSSIDAMATMPGLGFLQIDCLGYGPWLDARTVSFCAAATGGEAVMVEGLGAASTGTRVIGMLARSMVRAASQLTLRVSGATVLAATCESADDCVSTPPAVSLDVLTDAAAPAYTLAVLPGDKLELSLLHAAGQNPSLSICGTLLAWPAEARTATAAEGPLEMTDGWEMVDDSDVAPVCQNSVTPDVSATLARLEDPATARALRHLPLLEPAYMPVGRVVHPVESALERRAATLGISLAGQVVAPSVTKGCAVASLTTSLQPVPETCRPQPSSLAALYQPRRVGSFGTIRFADEMDTPTSWNYPYHLGSRCDAQPEAVFRSCGAACSTSSPGMGCGGVMRSLGASFQSVPPTPLASYPIQTAASAAPPPPCLKRKAERKSDQTSELAGPPSFTRWLTLSRGGLYPAALELVSVRLSSLNASPSVVRLTNKELSKELRATAERIERELIKMPPSTNSSSSAVALGANAIIDAVSEATLAAWTAERGGGGPMPLGRHLLRLVECTAFGLKPEASPAAAAMWKSWVSKQLVNVGNDCRVEAWSQALLAILVAAARTCTALPPGISEALGLGPTETQQLSISCSWPWELVDASSVGAQRKQACPREAGAEFSA